MKNIRTIESFVKKVITAPAGESVMTVARLMKEHNVGAVVITEGHKPLGIVTDRDLVLRALAPNLPPQTPIRQVMSAPVKTVFREDGLFDTTRTMLETGVRRLPVLDQDELLIGIVTLDDLLRILSRELANLSEGIKSEMEVK